MTYQANFKVRELNSPLLQADILAPVRYLDLCKRTASEIEPEKKLMLAVLVDAIELYQNYVSRRRKISRQRFLEAEQWIREENQEWPFSFENICEALGFNPQYIHLGLRYWKERKRAELR